MPGRPLKSPLERRSFPIAVRFRYDEVDRLDSLAVAANQTISEYVRSRVLSDRMGGDVSPAMRHSIYRLLIDIRRGLRNGAPSSDIADLIIAVTDELNR